MYVGIELLLISGNVKVRVSLLQPLFMLTACLYLIAAPPLGNKYPESPWPSEWQIQTDDQKHQHKESDRQ